MKLSIDLPKVREKYTDMLRYLKNQNSPAHKEKPKEHCFIKERTEKA